MSKKILVVYYSQTGQLLEIVRSVTGPLSEENGIEIVFETLRPKPPFPFPWSSDEFFQAFSESVQAIPCELEPFVVSGQEHYDLVILAWQPWYLSPSIPIHAFLQHPDTSALLSGRPVITLIGCRNMWVMAQERIKEYIRANGGRLVGNIVLYDRTPNLLSVISIVRWMLTGKRDRYMGFVPPAGISEADIRAASRFGFMIKESLMSGDYDKLQEKIIDTGGADVYPDLVMFEKRGTVFFKIWSRFILKKGDYGSIARIRRVRAFKYYLLAVIYLISPIGKLVFAIAKPFRRKAVQKVKTLYQSL